MVRVPSVFGSFPPHIHHTGTQDARTPPPPHPLHHIVDADGPQLVEDPRVADRVKLQLQGAQSGVELAAARQLPGPEVGVLDVAGERMRREGV